ncbi:tRNA (adenosine(37)-N6)-threonylcarbamoyltransferase complex transferase subunit TsaD [Alphaproteobacteria bacterium HT1-32]|nr:tRNA (adenosine(37)-N6)-threonylcarbamoyltransferase complex transferase subunit TsaD [Alphaproteobacteria bacterium HT1-32]
MLALGIETSCDETAAAVVDLDRTVRSNVVLSQIEAHQPYGGVVPEIAARAHLEAADSVCAEALKRAGVGFSDIDVIAATGGPGLIGGVLVGVMTGKAISMVRNLPFVAVNHLEAHALTARLTNDVPFPYLLLLVSGGHCQLLIAEAVGQYRRLGATIDDAAGEAFDKTAKLLGLGYPGGPAVEAAARNGDPDRYPLPRPMVGRPDCDFSFSGLKTAVRRLVDGFGTDGPTERDRADICASFQAAAGDVLVDRCRRATQRFLDLHPEGRHLVVAGGVAANRYLRARLEAAVSLELVAPPLALCTDNGAMVAWAGLERYRLGMTDDFTFAARPRWPLDPDADPKPFAGVKA